MIPICKRSADCSKHLPAKRFFGRSVTFIQDTVLASLCFCRSLFPQPLRLRDSPRQRLDAGHDAALLGQRRKRDAHAEQFFFLQAVPAGRGSPRTQAQSFGPCCGTAEVAPEVNRVEPIWPDRKTRELIRDVARMTRLVRNGEGPHPSKKAVVNEVAPFDAVKRAGADFRTAFRVLDIQPLGVPVRTQKGIDLLRVNWFGAAHWLQHLPEQHHRPSPAHRPPPASSSLTSPTIATIRTSFCKMLSTSSAGGKCSMFGLPRGFLRSRLQPVASKSAAGIVQARSFSSRLFHHSRQSANSSNVNGCVLV